MNLRRGGYMNWEAFSADATCSESLPLIFRITIKESSFMNKSFEEKAAEECVKSIQRNNGPSIASRFLTPGSMCQKKFSTGFHALDKALSGGFTKGLSLIGAIPGIGKSAMCINLAYEMCKTGTNVIYLSLEMDADSEIMARMISLQSSEMFGFTDKAFTVDELTRFDAEQFATWDYKKQDRYFAAVEAVVDTTKTLTIWDHQDGTYSTKKLEEDLKKYFAASGENNDTPILIVDYVQILDAANAGSYGTDKMRVEATLRNLKSMSVKYDMPIIAISALSRESYKKGVDLSSFKETGLMEYIAKSIIGLDLEGIGEKGFDYKDAMRQEPRCIDLSILKQRNAPSGAVLKYDFHLKYNRIVERESVAANVTSNARKQQKNTEPKPFAGFDA